MPRNLPPLLVYGKNKLASADPILCLLEITLTDQAQTKIYICHNTENIVWNNITWTAFPFQIELPKTSSKGEIPFWTIRLSNVTRVFQAYLEQLSGAVGSQVVMRFIDAGYLDKGSGAVYIESTMEVLLSEYDTQWITFKLGAENLLRKRFPNERYIANHCLWVSKFKGAECAYTGQAATCDGTLKTCRSYNNSARFGGKPGLSRIGVRLV